MVQAIAGGNGSPGRGELTINAADMDGRYQSADYYKHTDQTQAFQQVGSCAVLAHRAAT